MILYFVIYFTLCLTSLVEVVLNNRGLSNRFSLYYLIIIFILSFIRWETGTDWDTYYEMYTWVSVPWQNFDSGMEFGFDFVNHLAKMIFDSYTGVLFIFALIIYISSFKAIVFFSQYPVTSIFIYYSIAFASMLFVRQNVALSLLLLSLIYVKERRILLFVMFVFLASLFHRTAWIFLLVYPFFYRYYKVRTLICYLFIGCSVGFILSKSLLVFIGNLGLGIVSQKIEAYLALGSDDNSMSISTTAVLIKGLINRLFLLCLFFVFLNNERRINSTLNGLINIYIIGTILYCITLPLSISLARVAVYMDMVQILIIPNLINSQHKLAGKIIFWGIFALYFFTRFYSMYISYEEQYTPFQTIFSI